MRSVAVTKIGLCITVLLYSKCMELAEFSDKTVIDKLPDSFNVHISVGNGSTSCRWFLVVAVNGGPCLTF